MRHYLNRFTSGGGSGVLIGFGIWLSQGGIYKPDPTPTSYWVGVGFMVTGAVVATYGWFRSDNIIKEENVILLDDIKSDLVTLNTYEIEEATKKAKLLCSKETSLQIHDDYVSIFGEGVVSVIVAILQEILRKCSVDPLIEFFRKFGDILDSNDYGLKVGLEDNDLYESSKTDLGQKRVKLKIRKKKKITIQKNIDRVRALSYGLSSSVLLRSILTSSVPKARSQDLSVVRITLEGIETIAETTLNTMLNDLENEWVISKETNNGIESTISVLSDLEGVLESE